MVNPTEIGQDIATASPPLPKLDATIATAGSACQLGTDPSKFLERFEDWLEHHQLLADTVGVDDTRMLQVLLLWSGKDFRKLAKEAGVITEGDDKDSLNAAITKIRQKCGSHVNLSMAVFKLMHAKQGSRTFTEFFKEVEELATQCQFDTQPYDKNRAIKDAIIFGTSDEKLRQESLGKDFNLQQLRQAALGYEQSRRSTGAIKGERGEDSCRKLYSQEQVDDMIAKVTVGKYSAQKAKKGQKCNNCPPNYRPHGQGRCPATGRVCMSCKEKNHFAGAPVCKNTSVRAIDTEEEYPYQYELEEQVKLVENISSIEEDADTTVDVHINDQQMRMFVDSGCKRSLIPIHMYNKEMGSIEKTEVKFRPYGTQERIKCHGVISTTIKTSCGATHNSKAYIVEGHNAEPLLGRDDAVALGILRINKEGTLKDDCIKIVTDDLKAAGITLNS